MVTTAAERGEVPVVKPAGRVLYRLLVPAVRGFSKAYWRLDITGAERLPSAGGFILAPVHRSALDFGLAALVTRRRVRWMAKESIWKHPLLGSFAENLGAFRVVRGTPDRLSLRCAVEVVSQGEPLVIFPEGTRRSGDVVEDLFDGVAWVACRTRVPVVPLAIHGSDRAMAKGTKFPRPSRISLLVGEPIYPEVPPEGRIPRSVVAGFTQRLTTDLQAIYDDLRAESGAERRSSTLAKKPSG